MATDLAGRLNAILSEGRASTTVMQCRTTPVPKGDGSDPHVNSFRGVTVSGLLSKILSLALTRRTVHWALHHGLIDDAQAGFLPRRSSEQHVWVLMELLRSRFRHNSSTCLLFIDLKKAYDKTHLAALWEILNNMGAPPHLHPPSIWYRRPTIHQCTCQRLCLAALPSKRRGPPGRSPQLHPLHLVHRAPVSAAGPPATSRSKPVAGREHGLLTERQ